MTPPRGPLRDASRPPISDATRRDRFSGPHRLGKGCLYLKSLDGIDLGVLEKLVRSAIGQARARGVTG